MLTFLAHHHPGVETLTRLHSPVPLNAGTFPLGTDIAWSTPLTLTASITTPNQCSRTCTTLTSPPNGTDCAPLVSSSTCSSSASASLVLLLVALEREPFCSPPTFLTLAWLASGLFSWLFLPLSCSPPLQPHVSVLGSLMPPRTMLLLSSLLKVVSFTLWPSSTCASCLTLFVLSSAVSAFSSPSWPCPRNETT